MELNISKKLGDISKWRIKIRNERKHSSTKEILGPRP